MKQFTDATGVVMIEIEVYDHQIEWVDIHALQDLIELKKNYDELLRYCQENHL